MKNYLSNFCMFVFTLLLTVVTFDSNTGITPYQSPQERESLLSIENQKIVKQIKYNNSYVQNGIIVFMGK